MVWVVDGVFAGLASKSSTRTTHIKEPIMSRRFLQTATYHNSNRRTLRVEPLEDRLAPATHYTWSGAAGTLWNNPNNWVVEGSGNGVPTGNGNEALLFPASASNFTSENNLTSGNIFDSITINGSGYQIKGFAITSSESSLPIKAHNAIDSMILLDIDVSTTFNLTDPTSRLRMEGSLKNGQLRKEGPGDLELRGTNAFTGVTDIADGTLELNSPVGSDNNAILGNLTIGDAGGQPNSAVVRLLRNHAIGDLSAITINSDGLFDMNGFQDFIGSVGGSGNLSLALGSSHLWTGQDNSSTTLSGVVSGDGVFTKSGTGVMTLGGSSTFTGALGVDNGTVRLSVDNALADNMPATVYADSTLDLNNHGERIGSLDGVGTVALGSGHLWACKTNASTTFNGVISGTGHFSKEGTGTLTLGGANTFTGSLGIDAGTVLLGGDNVLSDDLPVVVYGPGMLDLNGKFDHIASLEGSGAVALGTGRLWAGRNNADKTFDGVMSGSGGFSKEGTGVLTLGGANSFTGDLGVDNGTVRLSVDNALANNMPAMVYVDGNLDLNGHSDFVGALQVLDGKASLANGALTVATLTMSGGKVGGGTLNLGGDLTTNASSNAAVISAAVNLGGVTRTLTISNGDAIYDLIIDGAIANGGVIKAGEGWLRYEGGTPNAYVGTTTVNDGGLSLAKNPGVTAINGPLVVGFAAPQICRVYVDADNQVSDSATVSVYDLGLFNITGGSETIGALNLTGGFVAISDQRTLTLNSNISATSTASRNSLILGLGQFNLGSGTRTFNISDGPAVTDLTVEPNLIGGAGIIKSGAGTMRISGSSNVYTGSTTINAGRLAVHGTIVNSPIAVAGGTRGGIGTTATVNATGGEVGPVDWIGILRTGNISLSPTTTLRSVGASTAAGLYYQVNVTGTVNLNGGPLLTEFSFIPAIGDAFTILANDGTDPIVGTFNGLPEGAVFTSNGKPYQITYAGGTGNDVVLTRIPAAVVVTPLSTRVTTEAGGTATFTVVLGSVPTADVTIAISSSDPSEGSISPSSLTFTPANALTPQTVTVTGLADPEADFNVAFNIVTGAAVSSDSEYSGLAVPDVPVINLDLLPNGQRTFTDQDGDIYTVKLTGTGSVATLLANATGNGPGAIDRIVVQGTDSTKSTLALTVKKGPTGDGRVNIGSIEGSGLKSISARASDLVGGGVSLNAPLGSLAIRDMLNGADVSAIGTTLQKTRIRAQVIGDGTTIHLDNPVSGLVAARVDHARIEAPSINSLLIQGNKARGIVGDFAADVLLSGSGVLPGKNALGAATIAGTVSGSTIKVNAGNVGSFKAGRFVDSQLLVGFTPTDTNDPMAGGAFASGSTIGSFRVVGYNGLATPAFANSTVAVANIGNVYLKSVQTTNAGKKFGVLADGQVNSVTVAGPAFHYAKDQPTAGLDDFQVKIV